MEVFRCRALLHAKCLPDVAVGDGPFLRGKSKDSLDAFLPPDSTLAVGAVG